MAFKLKKDEDGVLTGKTNAEVEIALRSDQPASTVRITYAGEDDGDAPFTFTIQKGRHKLLVATVGGDDGQKMTVVEVDGANENKLKSFFWSSSHFHTTLDIEGV